MDASTLVRLAQRLLFPVCLVAFGALLYGIAAVPLARSGLAAVPPQYLQVDRLVLPVIRREGLEGHLFLVIYLELSDVKDRPFVTSKSVPLRDEFIRSLNRYIAHRPRILYNVNLPELKAVLMKASARIVGEGKVKAILIQAAANRRFYGKSKTIFLLNSES